MIACELAELDRMRSYYAAKRCGLYCVSVHMAEATTSEYGRPWRLLAVIVVLFVLSALALISPFLCEEKESHYLTLAEAERDGAIERGWPPPWLPGIAVEINEIHDIDSNRGFIALRYAASDEGWYKSACQRIVRGVPPNPESRVNWASCRNSV